MEPTEEQSQKPAEKQAEKAESLEEFLDRAIHQGGFEFLKGKSEDPSNSIKFPSNNILRLDTSYGHTHVSKHLIYEDRVVAYLNRDAHGMAANQKAKKEYTLFISDPKEIVHYSESQIETAMKKFVKSASAMFEVEEAPKVTENLDSKVEGTQ